MGLFSHGLLACAKRVAKLEGADITSLAERTCVATEAFLVVGSPRRSIFPVQVGSSGVIIEHFHVYVFSDLRNDQFFFLVDFFFFFFRLPETFLHEAALSAVDAQVTGPVITLIRIARRQERPQEFYGHSAARPATTSANRPITTSDRDLAVAPQVLRDQLDGATSSAARPPVLIV